MFKLSLYEPYIRELWDIFGVLVPICFEIVEVKESRKSPVEDV